MIIKTNHPSDLTDQEWQEIQELFIFKRNASGRKPKYSQRIILNAIFYVLRTGCQWRYLPKDFPPWKTVYTQYRRWEKQNRFEDANHQLVKRIRKSIERPEHASGAIVDSQSVKTTEKGALWI